MVWSLAQSNEIDQLNSLSSKDTPKQLTVVTSKITNHLSNNERFEIV